MAMHGAMNHFTNDRVSEYHTTNFVNNTTERQLGLLLQQRQKLLTLYSSVANIYPGRRDNHLTVNVMARSSLCQLLVDYLAQGQLQVFAKLEDADQSGNITGLLNQMHLTTNNILDFSDKYATTTKTIDFRADLSNLAENLASHLELEDKIVNHYQTKQLVA